MDDVCTTGKTSIHIDAVLLPTCITPASVVKKQVQQFVESLGTIYDDFIIKDFEGTKLATSVQSISCSDVDQVARNETGVSSSNVVIHVFQLNKEEPSNEGLGDQGEDSEMSAAQQWILPNVEFHGLWENLIYETNIKSQLLNYISSTLLFSDRLVDPNIIAWNRVVLIHGPPGTGKTSLCRALAQKLSIQLDSRYKYGHFIEVNSHSLFSKWFSESGKLVMKMFQGIKSCIEDTSAFVILLIDEVESLSHARKSAMAGSEPSDAIRVVNALLTQIDYIRRYPNVLILSTSNITGAIDLAFVDRADIKQYIGLPSAVAIFQIYFSCITELMRTGIVSSDETLLPWRTMKLAQFVNNEATRLTLKLKQIAEDSVGLSGRALRKLPLLAHALFVQSPTVSLSDYLDALSQTVFRQFQDQKDLTREM